MHASVLINDGIVSAAERALCVGQAGLLSGWGVFTTLRIVEGIPFALERHWARMTNDAERLHVEIPVRLDEVRPRLLHLIETNSAHNATMRVCLVRNTPGIWAAPGQTNSSDLIALTRDNVGWQKSIGLSVTEHGRHAASPFAGAKTLSWVQNLTLAETAQEAGYGETILLNERGEVAECTSANIFMVEAGVTYTPPLSSGPLPGVTRALMLEQLGGPAGEVKERILRLEDLYAADELFITSTTRNLLPATRIQDRRVGGGDPQRWPVMNRLEEALEDYVREYVARAKTLAA